MASIDDLCRRLRSSDHQAFAELFDRLHEPLIRYARRFMADGSAAYDVVQDVFMRLWEMRTTLVVTSSARALLYTMVRNNALNLRRRSQWYDPTQPADGLDTPDRMIPMADDILHAAGLAENLRLWIREMPSRRAEAFLLSRYHDLSHREIGQIMGVSERTVDTHILLALRELRLRIQQFENDDERRT